MRAAKAAEPWQCPVCFVEVLAVEQYCSMCLRARPLPKSGVPQIFDGLTFHFNGVIPRTLKHPSHSVEWRMAERHGATCATNFDAGSVSVLIYRPGYERSDKVRLCVEKLETIPCVPISWMLDSLLQSRQIHPVLYRLATVPSVALPTVRGPSLPHHQHPYYVLNAEEHAIGPLPGKPTSASQRTPASGASLAKVGNVDLPQLPDLQDPQWVAFGDVWDAAMAIDTSDKGQDIEASVLRSKGIELLVQASSDNRVQPQLFRGVHILLSEALRKDLRVADVIISHGAKVSDALDGIPMDVTHVVYHPDDKKSPLLIESAFQMGQAGSTLKLATSTWLEDCLMLGEMIPLSGIYCPTAKLLATLQKKRDRRMADAPGDI